MDGLIYLLNQSGLALAQANERIAELTKALEQTLERKEGDDGRGRRSQLLPDFKKECGAIE